MIVGPIDDCNAFKYVEGVFAEIAISSTSLLFFFRVRAIYDNSRAVTVIFGFLWLSLSGLSILIMLGMTRGTYIVCFSSAMGVWMRTIWQSIYHTHNSAPKALHTHTHQSRSSFPLRMTPSFFLLSLIACSLSPW